MGKAGKIVMWVILGLLMVFLIAFVTQHLWNWLVPALFAGPVISFWQALGLLLLSKILFSGMGGKGCHHEGYKSKWKHKLHEKFSTMTPEERETFKQKMREKWCPTEKDESSGNANV